MAGLLVVVISIILFWLLEVLNPPLSVKTSIGGVIGIALTGILASLITQIYLRATMTDELLALMGVERTLREAGLEGVTDSRHVDWDAFLDGTDELTCLLGDPDSWISREWDLVKELAQRRRLKVLVYAGKPDTVPVEDTALTDALEPSGPHTKLQTDWVDLVQTDRLAQGSILTVRLIPDLPRYSMFLAGQQAMVFLHHSSTASNPPASLVLQFRQSTLALTPGDWLRNATREIDRSTTLHFEREYRGARVSATEDPPPAIDK